VAVKVTCDCCGKESLEDEFKGLQYFVEMASGRVKTLHVCDPCVLKIDDAMIMSLKEQLKIKGDVRSWSLTHYGEESPL